MTRNTYCVIDSFIEHVARSGVDQNTGDSLMSLRRCRPVCHWTSSAGEGRKTLTTVCAFLVTCVHAIKMRPNGLAIGAVGRNPWETAATVVPFRSHGASSHAAEEARYLLNAFHKVLPRAALYPPIINAPEKHCTLNNSHHLSVYCRYLTNKIGNAEENGFCTKVLVIGQFLS